MLELEYIRKPSIVTLKSAIKKAIAKGETFIVLQWGENQISLEHVHYSGGFRPQWVGNGRIGRNSGYDLANDLNKGVK